MNIPENETATTAQSTYAALESDRMPYLRRAWECSELTIPYLLPRNGVTDQELPTPFQNVGSRGVVNLSAKSLLTLFPPNTPFFKMKMDELIIQRLEQQAEEGKNIRTEIELAFGTMGRVAQDEIEASGDRATLGQAFMHIYVAGNVLLFKGPKQTVKMFNLNHYVVRRDPAGNVMEIVVQEEVDPKTLPEDIRQAFAASEEAKTNKKTCKLYTWIKRETSHWTVVQEVCGKEILETRGTYPLDRCPWIPVRFSKIDGENYGRGYVELYLGDFRSLENLTAAIVQGSAAAAKVLFLVKPNSSTKIKVLAQAPTGSIVSGNEEDVTVLHLDKAADFAVAQQLMVTFENRLSQCFMITTQRDAERVTAEEIRTMAQQLEENLGGVYSILSMELQLPYIRVVMSELQKAGKLPALPKGAARPTIVTGLEGLGRGQDANKLVLYLKTLNETMTPQVASRFVNYGELANRLAVSFGIETKGLIYTEDQIAANDQQAQRAMMIEKLGPNAVNAFGGVAKERVKADVQQQQAEQPAAAPAGQ
jgi:hypothetical protein